MRNDCGLCQRYGRGCQYHPDSGRPAHRGERARLTQRQSRALALRLGGATYRQIADALGVSVSVAHSDVQDALQDTADLPQERAGLLRGLEEERLDALLRMLADAMAGSAECPSCKADVPVPAVSAIGEARRVSESRRKLLGLDAPDRHIHDTVDRLEREVWPRWIKALRDAGVSDEQLQAAAEWLGGGADMERG